MSRALPRDREALVVANKHLTWAELRDSAIILTKTHRTLSRRRVGLRFRPALSSFALLFALEALEADVVLLDGRLADEEAKELAQTFRLAALLSPTVDSDPAVVGGDAFPDEAPSSGSASVTILTSGTTGKPKAAHHTWESLSRPARRLQNSLAPRWMQTYRPNLYAGLQVLLQCFVNYGTLYVPQEGCGPSEVASFMATHRVQYISATPSYWRWLLLFADSATLNSASPLQITLGGEVVDQSILNSLKTRFPKARIVHIYATTELGRCFSVSDVLEGFPSKFLDVPSPDGVEMRIRDSELLVRSANAMLGYDPFSSQTGFSGDWISTGDMVSVRGDRVVFTGRKSDIINVGGNKVHPVEVERVLRSVPGVLDVRVFGKHSSVAGQLVACEIVSDKIRSDDELREDVRRACQVSLSSFQRPRFIGIVDQIELSSAQKIVRNRSH